MADMLVLSVCYCTEKDGPHVHVPVMRDSQYGLRVHPDEPRETVSAPAAETREPASRFAGVRHYAEPVARGSEKTHPGRVEDCKRCNFGQPAPAAGDARGEPERKDE